MSKRYQVQDGSGAEINFDVRPGLVPESVFFIHGNLASNRWWLPAEEVWTAKAKSRPATGSLIYGEFRGCGKSSAPKNESEVDMHRFADDFIGLIKANGLGPVHLVGHSTGGLIAALMMAKEPTLFKKAVLLDPVGATGVTFDPSMIAAFEQMKADRGLTATVIGSTIHENDASSDFFQQVIVEDAFSAVKSVGHLVLKALDGLDARTELKTVRNSILVLHGEHDRLLSVDASRALADLMPGARFETFMGCGHCANVEAPKKFVEKVDSFLF